MNNVKSGTVLRPRFFMAMSRRMVDLAKIYFSELTRKIQEEKVFCEGAYPQRSVTERNTL